MYWISVLLYGGMGSSVLEQEPGKNTINYGFQLYGQPLRTCNSTTLESLKSSRQTSTLIYGYLLELPYVNSSPTQLLSQHHDFSACFVLFHAAMRLGNLVKVEDFSNLDMQRTRSNLFN